MTGDSSILPQNEEATAVPGGPTRAGGGGRIAAAPLTTVDPDGSERLPLETVAVWLVFAIFVLMRFPAIRHGAAPYYEEGATYLQFALAHGWWESLWHADLGYVSFWSNLTGVVEAAVPWSWVPAVSVVFGLAAPTAVIAYLARATSVLWIRLVGVTVVVWTMTMAREWYSPIHAQFWFTCALLLIVVSPARARWHRVADLAVAVVAGATGAVALAALPVLAIEAVRNRTMRRHLARVTVLLAVTGVVNMLAGSGRAATFPRGRLAYFVLLKTVWQPLTGDSGVDPAQSGWNLHGFGSAVLWVGCVALVAAIICYLTSGAARVLALGSLWVSAVMLRYALGSPSELLSPRYGGRYAVVGAVTLFCGLLFGARNRWSRGVAVVLASLAVMQGVIYGGDNPSADAFGRFFRADVAALAHDPGVTLRIVPPTCEVSPDVARQHAGFHVSVADDVLQVTPSRVDLGHEVQVFALIIGPERLAALGAADELVGLDGFFFGGSYPDSRSPGFCYLGPTPPAIVTSATGTPVMIELGVIAAERPVFIGAGRTFAAALATGNFVQVSADRATVLGLG